MQLSPDTHAQPIRIAGYAAGELRLRDRVLTASSIVTAERVLPWPVASVEALSAQRLEPVLELGVRIVLLATGMRQVWPAPDVLAHAAARGVGIEVMDLGAACRTFNLLVGDARPVALAAILGAAG
jgi:uncharacterized protein